MSSPPDSSRPYIFRPPPPPPGKTKSSDETSVISRDKGSGRGRPSGQPRPNRPNKQAHRPGRPQTSIPKVPSLNTPEEIAAWREARKQRWPTQANVKAREEAERARKEAQEVQGVQKTEDSEAHSSSSDRPKRAANRPCRYFLKNGKCRNGDKCSYSHDLQEKPGRGGKRPRPSKPSPTGVVDRLMIQDRQTEDAILLECFRLILTLAPSST
ncbi:MAG: hypothetical protein DHS80DRAFT_23393 [Piptocephalis tieghemiana]|nr:MAG: hypothetical protein DHS80DRAFT_23393 [Piptocephalis tieghemiana]